MARCAWAAWNWSLDFPDFKHIRVAFRPDPGEIAVAVSEETGAGVLVHDTTRVVVGKAPDDALVCPFLDEQVGIDPADHHCVAGLRDVAQPNGWFGARRFGIPVKAPVAGEPDALAREHARRDHAQLQTLSTIEDSDARQ